MSVPKVTVESVAAAVVALKAEGKAATQRAIHTYLDGGSFRDITRCLRACWDQEVAQLGTAVAANNAPSDIDKCLREAASEIEGIASRRAATELRGLRSELEAKIAMVASQRDSAMKDCANLADELERAKESNAALQILLEQQNHQMQSLQREVADARTERNAATAAQAATEARIADFKEIQGGLLRDLDAEKQLNSRLRECERESASELKAIHEQAAQADVTAARALAQAEARNQHLTQQVDSLEVAVVSARNELSETHKALVAMTERASELDHKLVGVRLQRGDLRLALNPRPPAADKLKSTASEIKKGGAL